MSGTQTQGELFRLLHGMAKDIGNLQGSVSTFVKQMEVQDERTTNLEVRVRHVEGGESQRTGARHVISGIVSAAVALVVTYFGGGHYRL